MTAATLPPAAAGAAGDKPQKWWQRPLMFFGIPVILAWLAVTEAQAARTHKTHAQTLGVSP
jgi:hypothetical protein